MRVAVLTGKGKCFCAGVDIKARAGGQRGPGEQLARHAHQARECFHAIMECKKPVIAAVNGPALGAGLARWPPPATSWWRAKAHRVGLPEIDVGLYGRRPARHATVAAHDPSTRARRMMLTGYRVSRARQLYSPGRGRGRRASTTN